MIRFAAALALCATPLAAQDALTWLETGIGLETVRVEAGIWHPVGGAIHATDPLTLWQTGPEAETITVPDTPARVVGLRRDEPYGDTVDPRGAVLALIWSDADVLCGEDLATIGVDTGLAGFMTPADVRALDAYAEQHRDLYDGVYADQIDTLYPGPFLTDLPGGIAFPVSGSGWGDGGYPVASLIDADGNMVALYTQFMGAEGEEWLLPPPCTDPIS
ncbi:DUF4241 domain-containing protein [Rhodobacterales bacterium HKCCE4037]|nr:DUF4241 domain-containing protein [Rhodobacterales bacterium HKCCE4037]